MDSKSSSNLALVGAGLAVSFRSVIKIINLTIQRVSLWRFPSTSTRQEQKSLFTNSENPPLQPMGH